MQSVEQLELFIYVSGGILGACGIFYCVNNYCKNHIWNNNKKENEQYNLINHKENNKNEIIYDSINVV